MHSPIIQFDTGTYRLSVTEAEEFSTISSSAKTVEVGDVDNPPTGLIASDRERAWFAVELGAGVNYRIEMEGVDDALPGRALAKPAVFAVYDEGGNQVDHISVFAVTKSQYSTSNRRSKAPTISSSAAQLAAAADGTACP